MSKGTPRTRDLAERLIAFEARGESSVKKSPSILLVSAKLRPALSTLMGNAGFRALLARALAIATEDFAALRAVHVKADGSLEGFEELSPPTEPRLVKEGGIVLISHLLSLLVEFIGEDLTVGLVADVWPKLPLKDLDLGGGGKK